MSERAGRKTTPGRTRVLETKGRMQHGDPNPGNRVTPPSRDATREAILAGTCPICGKTGFKKLAGHTYRAHGIDRMELRSMGGFVLKDSICAPDVSEACRQRTKERIEAGELRRGNPGGPGPYELTGEGKRRLAERNRQRGEQIRAEYESAPDRCRMCEAPIPFDRRSNATCGETCRRGLLAASARLQARREGKPGSDRPPKECVACGARFRPTGDYRTSTCSTECRTAFLRKRGAERRKGPGECKVCGAPVERQPGRLPAKTCGPGCLKALFEARDALRRKDRGTCKICGTRIPAAMAPTAKTCGSDTCALASRVESGRRGGTARRTPERHTSGTADKA